MRINVELDTETPWGPHEVCFNQRQNITYSTTKTNGSVYTWEITGGIIKNGQGGHQVLVDWEGIGNHKIWVHEKSVTIDTICYGVSEIFEVQVYKDPHEIFIDYVSISFDDEKLGIIQVNQEAILKTKGDYALYRKEWGAGEWNLVAEVNKDKTLITDGILNSDELSYEYKISSLNLCEEEIESLSHRTIHLYADAPNENEPIFLQWNPYEGWPEEVEKYEIWHKVDLEDEYKFIGVTQPQDLKYIADNGGEGFTHHFRIKAIGKINGYESWSNEASLKFNHNLTIPNVFTPNGDGINETFTIVKLEMYPANELTIFNRWGKTIYNKIGYQNEWSGENVPSGVYYYSLKIDSLKRNYKGWVHVLK